MSLKKTEESMERDFERMKAYIIRLGCMFNIFGKEDFIQFPKCIRFTIPSLYQGTQHLKWLFLVVYNIFIDGLPHIEMDSLWDIWLICLSQIALSEMGFNFLFFVSSSFFKPHERHTTLHFGITIFDCAHGVILLSKVSCRINVLTKMLKDFMGKNKTKCQHSECIVYLPYCNFRV